MPSIALAHLSVLWQTPPEVVSIAARAGYDAVGLRLIAVTETSPGYPLHTDRAMMGETKLRLADTGLEVRDIEFVKIEPDTDVAALEPILAAGQALGARHIITAPYDPDLGRLAERLAAIAELGRPYGITALLEFFPWTVVPDLSAVIHVVDATGRPDVGILVDTLHFARSGSSLDELAGVAPERLPFLHLCDAPAGTSFTTEQLLHTARAERVPPGEGEIDLAAILGRLRTDIPLSLEVPMMALNREEGPDAVARRIRDGALRVLAGMGRS